MLLPSADPDKTWQKEGMICSGVSGVQVDVSEMLAEAMTRAYRLETMRFRKVQGNLALGSMAGSG